MLVSRVQFRETDLVLSRFVAGCWRLRDWGRSSSELARHIEACVELGLTTFDHADIYGGYACEAAFGEALNPALRKRIEIVTKCGIGLVAGARPEHRVKHYDTSKEHIVRSAEASLRALRCERIDLLLIHRPDPLLDADEVAEAFHALRASGKVRHFGVSNFPAHDIELLEAHLDMPLVANQIELSVANLSPFTDGTLAHCQKLRITPMAWSPLAGGALISSEEPRWVRLREALRAVGQRHGGASISQVAMAWLLRHPSRVVPVLGTGKIERVSELVQAERIALDRQDWFSVWEASAGQPVP